MVRVIGCAVSLGEEEEPSTPCTYLVEPGMNGLSIKEVSERTGVGAGTVRMWEQRHGFPVPELTASGYRRYRGEVFDSLRRVVQLREGGLSMPAAIERAHQGRELPI